MAEWIVGFTLADFCRRRSVATRISAVSQQSSAAWRLGDLEIAELRGLDISDMRIDAGASEPTCSIARLSLQHLAAAIGAMVFTLENITLQKLQARFADPSLDLATLRSCEIEQLEIGHVAAVISSAVVGRTTLEEPLRLEPLRGMQGLLRTFLKDALWRMDVEAIIPLANGRIELGQIDLNHIGPDSRIAVESNGIVAYPPHGQRIEVLRFDNAEVRLTDGNLDIAAVLARALDSQPHPPLATIDPRIKDAMRRLRVDGEVRLGEGALGDARRYIVLSSQEADANRVDVASPALGEQISFRIGHLAAITAQGIVGGLSLVAGALSASVEGRVLPGNGAGAKARIELIVEKARLRDMGATRHLAPNPF